MIASALAILATSLPPATAMTPLVMRVLVSPTRMMSAAVVPTAWTMIATAPWMVLMMIVALVLLGLAVTAAIIVLLAIFAIRLMILTSGATTAMSGIIIVSGIVPARPRLVPVRCPVGSVMTWLRSAVRRLVPLLTLWVVVPTRVHRMVALLVLLPARARMVGMMPMVT